MKLKRRHFYVKDFSELRDISERCSSGQQTIEDETLLKKLAREYDPSDWIDTNVVDMKEYCYGVIKAVVWEYIRERVTDDVWEEMSEWEGSGSQGVFESPYGKDLICAVWSSVDNFWTGMKFLGK